MSRHPFEGNDVTVVMGYDRPLDYLFMTVQAKNGLTLYSNVSDPEAEDCQDIRYFAGVLKEMKIEVPETMFKEVAKDQLKRVGNRIVSHPMPNPT